MITLKGDHVEVTTLKGFYFYFGFLFTYAVLERLRTARPITYLVGGSLVEAHSSSYICLSHARTVFSCGAPWCNPASAQGRVGVWALVAGGPARSGTAKVPWRKLGSRLQFDIS